MSWAYFQQIQFFTARVHSTREGTVFTCVCLSTFRGVPTFRMVGGYLLRSGWWGEGGTYLGWGGGYLPMARVGGYLPMAGVGGYLPMARVGGGVPTYGQGGGVPTLARG